MAPDRADDTKTMVTVAMGLQATLFLAPLGWFALNAVGYTGMVVYGLTTAQRPNNGGPGEFLVFTLFAVFKIGATATAAVGLGLSADGCRRALNQDESGLFRGAAGGLAAAALGGLGALGSFDCLGVMIAVPVLIASGIAVFLVLSRARELRDADAG